MLYGVLKNLTNTGADGELQYYFVAPTAIRSNQPAFVQDTLSLKRLAGQQGPQRWELQTNVESENISARYLTHSLANGVTKIIYIRMPQVTGLSLTTTPANVIANAAAEASTIQLDCNLVPGEFIQFSNHTKVYMVLSSASQIATITPALRAAVPSGTALKTGSNVTLHARYDYDTIIGISYRDGVLSDPGTIKYVEAV